MAIGDKQAPSRPSAPAPSPAPSTSTAAKLNEDTSGSEDDEEAAPPPLKKQKREPPAHLKGAALLKWRMVRQPCQSQPATSLCVCVCACVYACTRSLCQICNKLSSRRARVWPNALCLMPNALCLMPNALCTQEEIKQKALEEQHHRDFMGRQDKQDKRKEAISRQPHSVTYANCAQLKRTGLDLSCYPRRLSGSGRSGRTRASL